MSLCSTHGSSHESRLAVMLTTGPGRWRGPPRTPGSLLTFPGSSSAPLPADTHHMMQPLLTHIRLLDFIGYLLLGKKQAPSALPTAVYGTVCDLLVSSAPLHPNPHSLSTQPPQLHRKQPARQRHMEGVTMRSHLSI